MQQIMNSLWDIPFVVVDVETTGADAKKNRIMEIACIVVSGGEIIERFSSLVNPHQFIPPFIAKMTGIDNAMVYNAPEAHEVMPRVRDLLTLPNAIFVAHHVQFDWQFVIESFKANGIVIPEIPLLCSYKLARRLLPTKVKKNVGDVAKYFDITIQNRHRAEGDAEATALFTVEFLRQLSEDFDIETVEDLLQFQNKQLANVRTAPTFVKRVAVYLEQLPEEPGIYKMIDAKGDILYVGKAKLLRDRVRSYFQPGAQHTEKIAKMVTLVHSIEWECTATELSALLLESKEIKRLKPPFNTASKTLRRFPFLRLSVNEEFPRLEWSSSINDDGAEYYGPFRNRTMTREIADTIQQDFTLRLCRDELQPSADFSPCFYYHIKRCHAPCGIAIASRVS
jgi:DNA polymerase-3 subunit epsilon